MVISLKEVYVPFFYENKENKVEKERWEKN